MPFDIADPYKGAHHVMGGLWSHHVSFIEPDHVLGNPKLMRVPIWGRLPDDNPIEAGQCIVHRYSHHWIRFEIASLYRRDEMPAPELIPPEMFFGTLIVMDMWSPEGDLVWERSQPVTSIFDWAVRSIRKVFANTGPSNREVGP